MLLFVNMSGGTMPSGGQTGEKDGQLCFRIAPRIFRRKTAATNHFPMRSEGTQGGPTGANPPVAGRDGKKSYTPPVYACARQGTSEND